MIEQLTWLSVEIKYRDIDKKNNNPLYILTSIQQQLIKTIALIHSSTNLTLDWPIVYNETIGTIINSTELFFVHPCISYALKLYHTLTISWWLDQIITFGVEPKDKNNIHGYITVQDSSWDMIYRWEYIWHQQRCISQICYTKDQFISPLYYQPLPENYLDQKLSDIKPDSINIDRYYQIIKKAQWNKDIYNNYINRINNKGWPKIFVSI